jgi:hypothetical protein
VSDTTRFNAPVGELGDAWDEEDWQPGLWSGWRWPAVVGAVAAALVHLPVMADHVQEAPYMGVLFAVFGLVALGLAAALLLADTPVRYALLGVWCLLAVAAYAATRLVALPGLEHDVGHWTDPWGMGAVAVELAVAISCVAALRGRREASG